MAKIHQTGQEVSMLDRLMQPTSEPLQPADILPVIAGITHLLKANDFE